MTKAETARREFFTIGREIVLRMRPIRREDGSIRTHEAVRGTITALSATARPYIDGSPYCLGAEECRRAMALNR